MGQILTKLKLNVIELFKYCSCHSSCCGSDVAEIELKNTRQQYDTDYYVKCCGCFELIKISQIHSIHNNN